LKCSEFVSGNGWTLGHTCNKPAKGYLKNGKPGCGIHLAAERRARENGEKRNAKWDIQATRRLMMQGLARDLGAGSPSWDGAYISLTEQEARGLIERLGGTGAV
jgi:hypothetical protein